MKEKKKYITPTSELIKIKTESILVKASAYGLRNNNWLLDKNTQVEKNDMGNLFDSAPKTWGDYKAEPGGDIDIGAKVNPWGSWDE